MLSEQQKKQLQKADYKLVGEHAAVKLCHWLKESIKTGEKRFCYKEKFYGIKSHRCLQMAPCLPICNLRCLHCWRDHSYFQESWKGDILKPKELVDKCIQAQRELLTGLGGVAHSKKHLAEANEPNQVALSLDGEPMMYPYIDELIGEFNNRGFTTFLVTNGTFPDKIKSLKNLPTNFYVSLTSHNEKMFKSIQKGDCWEKLIETLKIIPTLSTTTVIRITLIKGINDKPEGFAELLKLAKPKYIEVKSYMNIGGSTKRLKYENMPTHKEVKIFSEKLSKLIDYKIKDEQESSRVVLLEKIIS